MSERPPAYGTPSGVPAYGTPPGGGETAALTCPKCHGIMRTYERNGIHIEQCATCRGIFLDFGELEALSQLEGRLAQPAAPAPQPQYVQQAPPPGYYGPGWGHHGSHHYRKGGFSRLFFSS